MSTKESKKLFIEDANAKIKELQMNIRNTCFENIKEEKNISLGDLIYVSKANKFGIFTNLYNEDIDNPVIRVNYLTKKGLPSKNVTTVNLADLEKCSLSLEDILKENFTQEEDFDLEKALKLGTELMLEFKK